MPNGMWDNCNLDNSAFREAVKKGDAEACQVFEALGDQLVLKLAREMNFTLPRGKNDIIELGRKALQKSLERFNPQYGTAFSVFAERGLQFTFGKVAQQGFKDLSGAAASSSSVHDAQSFSLAQNIPQVTHTKVIGLTINGRNYSVHSWTDMLVQLAKIARAGKHGDLLEEVTPEAYHFTKHPKLFYHANEYETQQISKYSAKPIGDGLYIETNFNAQTLVIFARWLADWCGIALDSIVIQYVKRLSTTPSSSPADTLSEVPTPTKQPSPLSEDNSSEKIGAYARRMLTEALTQDLVPESDFQKLCTYYGTKEILGHLLSACPLFTKVYFEPAGRRRFWSEPVTRRGEKVYINSQWFEEHRPALNRMLARWKIIQPTEETPVNSPPTSTSISKNSPGRKRLTLIPRCAFDLTGTKPVYFLFNGGIFYVNSWGQFASAAAKEFVKVADQSIIASLKKRISLAGNAPGRFYASHHGLHTPKMIADGIWIETNRSANILMQGLISQAAILGVDLNAISCTVEYMTVGDTVGGKQPAKSDRQTSPATAATTAPRPKHLQKRTLSSTLAEVVSGTKPYCLNFNGKQYPLASWKDFLQTFTQRVLKVVKPTVSQIAQLGKLVSRSPESLISPRQVSSRFWIETNQGANSLVMSALRVATAFSFKPRKFGVTVEFAPRQQQDNAPKQPAMAASRNAIPSQPSPALRNALLQQFPNGIVLSPSSLQLLAAQLPREERPLLNDKLIRRMTFARMDGMRLLPEMVANEDTIAHLKDRISNRLSIYPAYALGNLQEEFADELRNLPDARRDFELFLSSCVLQDSYDIIGKWHTALCVKRGSTDKEIYTQLTNLLRQKLTEVGDAVSQDDLQQEFPFLNAASIEFLCQDEMNDAVSFIMDDQRYWKLLEFYYLPDDFAEQLQAIVDDLEKTAGAVVFPQLVQKLKELYGDSFQSDYAVDDDTVLKQVIQAAWSGQTYRWKGGNVFAPMNSDNSTISLSKPLGLAEAFRRQHQGVFHQDDFIAFARSTRGIKSPDAPLVLSYLQPNFIRLEERLWIPEEEFVQSGALSNDQWLAIEDKLLRYLSSQAFFPVKDLPNAFYIELAPLVLNGNTYYWNPFLLVSIAARNATKFIVTNYSVAPYTITALLLPLNAPVDNNSEFGIVDYTLKTYLSIPSNPRITENAFEFLQKNNIRLVRRSQLLAHITHYLENC